MENPIVDKEFLVQKQGGKMGWTFVVIPDIPAENKDKLGLIRIRGTVDSYEFKQFNLLPMKGGDMLLPLKSAVRKKIGKKVGDTVRVTLYLDNSHVVIPEEITVCLLDSERAYQFFLSLSESNQKYYIDWIEEAKRMETKVERICRMIERLEKGLRFWDW